MLRIAISALVFSGLPLFVNNNLAPEAAITRQAGAGLLIASVGMASADVAAPAANTAAVITYAAVNARHSINGIAWSYSAAPTGGNLLVQDGGTTILNLDITAAGSGVISFPQAKRGATNSALVITLAAGGGGVSGKVSVIGHWVETPP